MQRDDYKAFMNPDSCFRVIENPSECMIYNTGMNTITIIKDRAEVVPLSRLRWNEEREVSEEMDDFTLFKFLSLHEIAKQLGEMPRLLVIVETPTYGYIYRHGNHGAVWELVGRTCGYA